HQSFGKVEHASVFLVFYLPLFMLGSEWGRTWSLDALLARRAGRATTSPSDDSWRLALPMRGVLLMLVLLFFSAVFAKDVFVDWQKAVARVVPRMRWLGAFLEAVPSGVLIAGVLGLAALAGWWWNLTPTLRTTLQLGGWLDSRTIWLPVLPLALVWWLRASLALLDTGRRSATGGAGR